MSTRTVLGNAANSVLRHANIQIVRGRTTNPSVASYKSARRTIKASERAGVPLGDFIDLMSHQVGSTAATVDAILRIGQLTGRSGLKICEIGAGSGRYAEKIIAATRPTRYEVYETASDWLPRLRALPTVVVQPCDGCTMTATDTASLDLVHANKLFVYVPFYVTVSYLNEMSRTVREGGVVAFDIITERCLDDSAVDEWVGERTFYIPIPRQWVIDYLAKHDLRLLGSKMISLTGHHTELMVFRKEPSTA